MKIVILDGYTLNPGDLSWSGFEALGDFTCYERTRPEEVRERIGEAQAVITNKTLLTAEIISSCPSIRYIGVLATGFNVVDTAAAAERGIPVCNIPAYGTTAVAQFVFAHLLNICHHIQQHSESVRNGEWTASQDFCYWNFPLIELAGKTMGIIGFGGIGRATARIALSFGMNVLACNPSQDSSLENDHLRYTDLDTLLATSDVISLHCPLTAVTAGMINKAAITKMKDGVILINTSRGPLIVENDLADALNSGKIAAAGLDVVSTEPVSADNVLLRADNCYITPHIAWAPLEARRRLLNIAVENLQSFISGKTVNRVN